MKIVLKLVLVLVIFQFWQCSYAQKTTKIQKGQNRPGWVDNPYEYYPQSQYLVGVGSGDTREAAEKNAIAQLAKIFNVHVEVDETLIESVFESFKHNQSDIRSKTNLLNKTHLQSDVQLKNVKIDRIYFSEKEGLYYALAYLDRMETAALLEQDFEENNQLIKKFYEASKQETNKLHRLSDINKALALAQVNNLINEKYKVLSGGDGLEPAVNYFYLLIESRKIKEAIKVKIAGKGEAQEELSAYLRELIGRLGFSIVEQNPDLDIAFELTLSKTDLNRPGIVAYNWHFKIDVKDMINQVTLNTFNLKKRSAAISESEVRARILRTIKQELENKFYKQLMDYLNSF